ncbi:MAG: hypothetical protein ACRD5B_12710 [Nitrososphaeraceae archaeon]
MSDSNSFQAFLTVTVHVRCPAGFMCPTSADFQFSINHRPRITYVPNEFPGNEKGTLIGVIFGMGPLLSTYEVIQIHKPNDPPRFRT